VSRTRFLVVIAIAALLIQLFPAHAGPIKWLAIVAGVAYLAVRALRTYPGLFKQKKLEARQRRTDEVAYAEYLAELAALKASAGSLAPDDYTIQLQALHENYRDMLERKFGFA